jgi:transcriptional regulator with XRE-family HTH domain
MTPLELRIRALRLAKGISQDELAGHAGVSRTTINRIENQRSRTINLDVLERIARALDVSPAALIAEAAAKPARAKARRG